MQEPGTHELSPLTSVKQQTPYQSLCHAIIQCLNQTGQDLTVTVKLTWHFQILSFDAVMTLK